MGQRVHCDKCGKEIYGRFIRLSFDIDEAEQRDGSGGVDCITGLKRFELYVHNECAPSGILRRDPAFVRFLDTLLPGDKMLGDNPDA